MVEYKHVLVTGAAGFIGFHLSKRLLENGMPNEQLQALLAKQEVKTA